MDQRRRKAYRADAIGICLRNEGVAGPLREQAEESGDKKSTTHAGRAEHVPPGLF
jgi:hypothetical protein